MELHQIRYFLALCAELNFTRAADRCDVAQSSLTRAIKLLETELGGALFHRGRANTHLTSLGERVQPFLAQAYGEVQDALREAQDFARARTASLRLGLMRTLAPPRPAALVAALRARAPDIDLQVTEAGAQALQERLLAGELDAAIYGLPGLGADAALDHLPLYREPFVVVVQAGHRLARRAAVRICRICTASPISHAFIASMQPSSTRPRSGVDAPPAFRSDRDDWILALAAAGLGYALMPAESAAHPGTVALALADGAIAREIALVTLRGGRESPAVGALVHEAMRLRHRAAPAPPHDSALLSGAVLA